ncbi:uncharacterized protein BCR38DRAFT_405721 [Pseudomassariella vexata]|uniref:Uncharacterized protein n=1 Tax=Pseudomassariella vexata TaxID=1141098 RepID=A0A1Y2EET4_9PEZI|nr:uncharacterized protein BCR38DRAFT_405721 [Pseudomassariella vexata]ORY70069.1 hypothetical protein BCR38DRAFT_405721 [Pseudomassariella vexata]
MGLTRSGVLALGWVITACLASPMALDLSVLNAPDADLLVREGIALANSRDLEKRLSADFSMEKTWKDEVLFGGSWTDTQDNGALSTALTITCVDCYTKGTVTAELWEDLIHPSVKLEFNQIEAYVFLGLETNAAQTFSVNLFMSNSPIGLGFPGLSVGVVFFVDLVFSLTEEIDLTGGFYVKLADGAFLEADIFGGDITNSFFDGISSKSLPVTVTSGTATFKADLRLRVQCGAESSIDVFGIGAGAVVGIYANIIEFVAVIDSTPTCALESTEWWDLNVGALCNIPLKCDRPGVGVIKTLKLIPTPAAYAHLDVVIDWKTLGPVPTVSTTLLTAPTMSQCWIEGGGSSSVSATVTATTTGVITSPAAVSASLSEPFSATDSSSYSNPATPLVSSFISNSARASASVSLPLPTSYGPSITETTFNPVNTTSSAPVTTSSPPLTSLVGSSGVYSHSSPLSNSSSYPGITDTDLVTSTVYSTTVYTITACAAGVINCPASYQKELIVTQTIDSFTTICAASANITAPPQAEAPTMTTTLASPDAVHVITDAVTLIPCPIPIIATFVPPSSLAVTALAKGEASVIPETTAALLRTVTTPAAHSIHADMASKWTNTTTTIARTGALISFSYSTSASAIGISSSTSATQAQVVSAAAARVEGAFLAAAAAAFVAMVHILHRHTPLLVAGASVAEE